MSQTAATVRVCPRCGEENPDRFRLCGYCGAELAPAPAQEVRKTVTVLFCDLKGSTSLGESIDTESLRDVLNRYFGEMRRVVERHGGRVEKFIGDAVMAVFGLPRVHEDDALRAVRAAADMRAALESLNEDLERRWGVRLANRIGVNTGEVVAGDVSAEQRLVTGDTVNVAARLEQAAPEMEALIGESTYRLVRDAVEVEVVEPLELKGKAERVPAYRLLSADGRHGYARRPDAPMVGRTAELDALGEAFREAAADRTCRMLTVMGAAGVGKSRLVAEFLHRVAAGAVTLHGHCLSYGEGITFWPLAEVVRQAAGIGEEDELLTALGKISTLMDDSGLGLQERDDVAERVAAITGISAHAHRIDETFWAVRKFLEAVAWDRPVVVLVDDIHWAEPTLLDLLEHLATSSRGAPLVFLCTARDELLEHRPDWGAMGSLIRLQPLADDESALVAENLLGTAALPPEARRRIVEAAQGNPLFVEQLLSMLIDDGSLAPGGDGTWVLGPGAGALAVPPTISALLAARLDRLSDDEGIVIGRASVVGEVFYREAVQALSPGEVRDRVGPCLSSLSDKQLVGPAEHATAWLTQEDTFRFLHILIRESAYGGLLKKTRAELHEGFADWLEATAGPRVLEVEEILAYHLEQAYRYRLDLGRPDEHVLALGARAGARLAASGKRALARGDSRAAANLLDRAASMLPPGDPERLELLPDLGEARMDSGEFAGAEETLGEAIQRAAAAADTRLGARAQVGRLMVRWYTHPEGWGEEALAELPGIIDVMDESSDHLGLARAWALMGYVHGTACRFSAAEVAVGLALEHARKAGDRREEARNLSAYAQSALYGPMPVPEAIERCEALLKEAEGDRRAEALVLCALARLHALAGDPETARAMYRRSRAIHEDLGGKLQAALVSIDSGPAELLAGDLEAAERELRADYEVLQALGERAYLATTAAWLAMVLCEQGRLDEAVTFIRISEETTAPNDVEIQMLWRTAQGRALAQQGRLAEGEAVLRQAVTLIEDTEQPDAHGMVLLELGRLLAAAGRGAEALPVTRSALELFELKGNVVSAAKARELQAELNA